MKRVISVILILVVILMSSACSKSNEGNQSKKPDAGMKEESNGYQKIPIQKPDDSPIVESICYLDNGVLRIVTADSNQLDVKIWDSKDNGITWEAATNVSDLIGNNPSQEPIVVALSSQGEMTIKQSVLYYVDNNKQAIEITESVPNAYDYKYADDGSLYTHDEKNVFILDKQSGAVTQTIPMEEGEQYIDSMILNRVLIVFCMDAAGQMKMNQYNIDSREKIVVENKIQSQVAESIQGTVSLASSKEEETVYFVSEGLYKYGVNGMEMNTIIDQISDNPSAQDPVMGLTVNEKGTGFVVKSKNMALESDELYYFTNDKAVKQEAKKGVKQLTIYSLKANPSLWQSIAMFQKEYSDIEVDLQVGYTGEDGITMSDAIRNLNTAILAKEGPDVLVLDNLPIAQYVEKGVLEEVGDIVKKSEKKAQFFDNIIAECNSGYKGKKIYAIPTSFKIPIIIGDEAAVSTTDVGGVVNIMNGKRSANVPVITPENFPIASVYLAATSVPEMFTSENSIDKEKLSGFFQGLKEIAGMSVLEKSQVEWMEYYSLKKAADGYPGLAGSVTDVYFDRAQVEMGTVDSVDGYAGILSASNEKNISYGYLNAKNGNSFIPLEMLGMTSTSKEKEAAKMFMEFYLSEKVQDMDEGAFSINQESLRKGIPVSESGESHSIIYKDREAKEGLDIKKLTAQEADTLISFIEKLDTSINMDAIVLQTLMEQADKYIYENVPLKDAVNAVSEKIDLYTSE